VGRVEEIRKLGAKVNRQIPPGLTEEAGSYAVEREFEEVLRSEFIIGFDITLYVCALIIQGNFKIVIHLQSKPELGRGTEIAGKTQGSLGRNASFPCDNLIDAPDRNIHIFGYSVFTEIHGGEIFINQNSSGMKG
jgi:hypothetical protein